MNIITGFLILMITASSLVYAAPPQALQKEEAIVRSRMWARISNPRVNLDGLAAKAVFIPRENIWIVSFTGREAEEYMFRVEATSGRRPQLLRESQKERYKGHLEN